MNPNETFKNKQQPKPPVSIISRKGSSMEMMCCQCNETVKIFLPPGQPFSPDDYPCTNCGMIDWLYDLGG